MKILSNTITLLIFLIYVNINSQNFPIEGSEISISEYLSNSNPQFDDDFNFSMLLGDLNISNKRVTIVIDQSFIINKKLSNPVNKNVTLKFINGNVIEFGDTKEQDVYGNEVIVNSGEITINGQIDAGLFEIFRLPKADILKDNYLVKRVVSSYLDNAKIKYAYPQWFGAIVNDKIDDYLAIQQALNFHKDIFLPTGIYHISKHLEVSKNDASIIGSGLRTRITTLESFNDYNMLQNFKYDLPQADNYKDDDYGVYHVKIENLHFLTKQIADYTKNVTCINLVHPNEGGVIRDTYFSSTHFKWEEDKYPTEIAGKTAIKLHTKETGPYSSINVFLIENCINYGLWKGKQLIAGDYGNGLNINKYTFGQSEDSILDISGLSGVIINDSHFEYAGWIKGEKDVIRINKCDIVKLSNLKIWNDGGWKKENNPINNQLTAIHFSKEGDDSKIANRNNHIVENTSFLVAGYQLGFDTYIQDDLHDKKLKTQNGIRTIHQYSKFDISYIDREGEIFSIENHNNYKTVSINRPFTINESLKTIEIPYKLDKGNHSAEVLITARNNDNGLPVFLKLILANADNTGGYHPSLPTPNVTDGTHNAAIVNKLAPDLGFTLVYDESTKFYSLNVENANGLSYVKISLMGHLIYDGQQFGK
ncbi:hypothetical protein [uncultured Algibacter sp.]|uniref:hypothetical protein n=1 Tax=uncultured Algibacter sp. TaxID=298659 RepID=UPI00260AC933|nr:hypothetical protein [uncultured Algibacter sp.]